jgi:hypothetical protein
MKRRELMLLLGGAMAVAGPLRAQQKTMPVIGLLSATTLGGLYAMAVMGAFRQGVNAGEKMHRRAGVKMHHRWVGTANALVQAGLR